MASIELTDLQSEKLLVGHTKDLTLFGCFVKTMTPFQEGIKVRMTISHAGVKFIGTGKVVYSRAKSGMGISFVTIEPKSQEVLDLWLAKLRK
jgi:hypothetical protein